MKHITMYLLIYSYGDSNQYSLVKDILVGDNLHEVGGTRCFVNGKQCLYKV